LKTVGKSDVDFSRKLNNQVLAAVKSNAPKGKLPLRSKRSRRYLEELADAYFNVPYEGGYTDD
jgi:hypothetical protein